MYVYVRTKISIIPSRSVYRQAQSPHSFVLALYLRYYYSYFPLGGGSQAVHTHHPREVKGLKVVRYRESAWWVHTYACVHRKGPPRVASEKESSAPRQEVQEESEATSGSNKTRVLCIKCPRIMRKQCW